VWFTDDRWIISKPRVQECVSYHQWFRPQDRMSTERKAAICLAVRYTDTRLEPLPICVDQRNQDDGRVEDPLSHASNAIEPLLGWRIENA
jgi:hypothetical protein